MLSNKICFQKFWKWFLLTLDTLFSSCCLTHNLKKFGKHFSKSTAKIFWHEVLTSCEEYLRTFFYCVYMYVMYECVHKWEQERATVCAGFQRTLWIFCLVPLWDLGSSCLISAAKAMGKILLEVVKLSENQFCLIISISICNKLNNPKIYDQLTLYGHTNCSDLQHDILLKCTI